MELQYQKAMEEYELKYADLPEDAQTGIDGINDVIKGIAMLEKRGKKVTPKTLKKLKAMDKWVYYEILDHLQGTDKNEEDLPEDPKEVVDEIKDQLNGEQNNVPDKLGSEIESELEKIFNAGIFDLTFEDIKTNAKKTYDLLFKTYDEGEENGIITTKYSLKEIETHKFKLTKL